MSNKDKLTDNEKDNENIKKTEPKSNHNKILGTKGETAAVKFLKNKGYEIIDTNWSCSAGECDIVAKYDETLIFVEVKTRSNLTKGLPEDAVGAKKRKKYECIAAMYLLDHDYVDMPVRFDVIAILVIKQDRALVRHHINAFGVS